MKILLTFMVLLTCFDFAGTGQEMNWQRYVCHQTTDKINVDGDLNDSAWKKAKWTSYFGDIEGDKKPQPLYPTRVKMLWDSLYFYIAGHMEEPNIWATYTQRDAIIFHENNFEVFIDPDGDTHLYYELEINALGTIWDLMLVKPYRDGGPALDAWDIKGLKKAIKIDGTLNDPADVDNYWSVELAIPWEVLKEANTGGAKPEDGQQWRVNFSRVRWKIENNNGKYIKSIDPQTGKNFPEFNWTWSPQGVIAMHQPETWGIVQFSEVPVGTKDVNFIPNQEEEVKWILRELYYAQHQHRAKMNRFAAVIEDLDIPEIVARTKSLIKIYASSTQFEISYTLNSEVKWHISQDGRTWKSKH